MNGVPGETWQRAPTASIVIPVRNAEQTINAALDAILGQLVEGPFEVIVVDNSSTDRSAEIISARAQDDPRVQLIEASDRRGAAYTRNVGAAHATSSLLIFVDADDFVEPGWLNAFLTAATDPCLLAGPVDEWKLARHPTWGAAKSRFRPPMTLRGQPFAISANCALSRSLFELVNGFQCDLGGSVGEDVELSWHVESLGIPIQFVPEAIVVKRPRSTRRQLFYQWCNYGMSTAVLLRRYPSRTRPRSDHPEWSPTRSQTVRDAASCCLHPVANQGVLIQMSALFVGRIGGLVSLMWNKGARRSRAGPGKRRRL